MIYCTKCGNQLDDNAKYCTRCTALVNNGQGIPANTYNAYSAPYQAPSNKLSKTIGLIAACVAGVSAFFPFIEINVIFAKQSLSLMSPKFVQDGYIVLGIAFFVLLLNAANKTKVFNILGGMALAGIAIIDFYFNQKQLTSTSIGGSNYDMSGMLTPGIGFYLLLASGIALLVAGFLHKKA